MNVVELATKPLWLRALPYVVLAGIGAATVASAYLFGVHTEHQARVAEVATLNLQHTRVLAQVDREHRTALQAATDLVRATELKAASDMAALDLKYTKELKDAKNRNAAEIAAVRAGAWRVRDEFTCAGGAAGPGGDVSAAGPGAGVDHGSAGRGLGPEDAAEILDAADTGDRWAVQLRACQEIVRQDRASAKGALQP